MILHIWEKLWLIPPTSIRKPDHRPALPKPSLILLFLLLQPHSALRSSLSAPWASDERLREMAVLLVISAPGHLLSSRSQHTPVPRGPDSGQVLRMGRAWGGLVLTSLAEHTRTKSSTHPLTAYWITGLHVCNCLLWISAFSTLGLCKLYLHAFVNSCNLTVTSRHTALWY